MFRNNLKLALAGLLSSPGFAVHPLSLTDYLQQVKANNGDYQSAVTAQQSAQLRAQSKDLITTPSAFANVSHSHDGKLQSLSTAVYKYVDATVIDVGVQQQTIFGLQGKLHYELDIASVTGLQIFGVPPQALKAFPTTFYQGHPTFEASLPLWSNGFGRSVQANQDLTESSNFAQGYASKFQARTGLVQAEQAYWLLAVSRDIVEIGHEALANAKKIQVFEADRASNGLGDDSDLLQAKAAVAARELELKLYMDNELAAARSFNSLRNQASAVVQEPIEELGRVGIAAVSIPARAEHRDDTLAAEQQARATASQMALEIERNKPTIDLVGTLGLNSFATKLSDGIGQSFKTDRPTEMIGIRLNWPLDGDVLNAGTQGAVQNKIAAQQQYQQKLLTEDQMWQDLVEKVTTAKERHSLSRKIEDAQQRKLYYERDRLRRGRTTTYQVLAFESDYLQARIACARAAFEVLNLAAQLKLYAGDEL